MKNVLTIDVEDYFHVAALATSISVNDWNNIACRIEKNTHLLLELFDQNDARQVLHVTFGIVLTSVDQNGKSIFRDKIYDCLKKNEEVHYNYLINHFKNHLNPFK